MPGPDRPDGWNRRDLLAWTGAAVAGAVAAPWARAATPAAAARLTGWHPEGLNGTFTLSNATVVTHEGRRMAGAGVRVEDGQVVALGPSVTGGVDLGGRWIVPGFTDAGCQVGLVEVSMEGSSADRGEDSDAVVPDARAWDGYHPLSDVIGVTRAHGITSVLVQPAANRLVPGQVGLLQTAGRTRDEALLHSPAGLLICLGKAGTGGGGPSSRMGVAMRLRELFAEVDLPDAEAEASGRKRRRKGDAADEGGDGDHTPAERVWRAALTGELPVLFHAERADDVLFACELAREWKLRAALMGAAEAWIVADEVAASEMPVLLGPLTVQPDRFEHAHARYDNAAMLHARGVPLAFRTGAAHFSRGLSTSAGVAVAHGLPWEAAITALTAGVGDALGIEGHGHLAEGAAATFFVSEGDPLQPRHAVQRVWIGGQEASMDHRQRRLFQQYRELW